MFLLTASAASGSESSDTWYPSLWARSNCSTVEALIAADPHSSSVLSAGRALDVSRGSQLLTAGATYAPGEMLRLSIAGDSAGCSHQYAFYVTAGQFDRVWAGWCGGLLAANEPVDWMAATNASEVTILAARTGSSGVIIYEPLLLRRAGAGGPTSGNVSETTRIHQRPAPGTGTEAFVAASTPLILLLLGVAGLLFNALSERQPPPGAVQIVDRLASVIPHMSPRLGASV